MCNIDKAQKKNYCSVDNYTKTEKNLLLKAHSVINIKNQQNQRKIDIIMFFYHFNLIRGYFCFTNSRSF